MDNPEPSSALTRTGIADEGSSESTAPKQQHQSRHREYGGHGPRQHALPGRCRRLWFRRACVSLSGNEPLDLHACIADRLQPAFRILLQAPPQQRMQLRWKRFRKSAPVGRTLQHRRQRVRNRRFVEEPASRNHLEQYDPERPDVGAPVGDVSAHLLRCHVCSRTENHAGGSKGCGAGDRWRIGELLQPRGRCGSLAR